MKSHITRLRVRYGETDQMGVVYHGEYLVYCEIGRTEMIRSLGMSYAAMEERGCLLAVSEAHVRFHSAARYDDPIVVETWLTDLRSRAVTFDYLITHEEKGTRLISAQTKLVAIDRSGKPTAMPEDIRHLLGVALAKAN